MDSGNFQKEVYPAKATVQLYFQTENKQQWIAIFTLKETNKIQTQNTKAKIKWQLKSDWIRKGAHKQLKNCWSKCFVNSLTDFQFSILLLPQSCKCVVPKGSTAVLKARNPHSELMGGVMGFELHGIIHWQTPTEPDHGCNSTSLWITCWNQWDNEPAQDYTCADVSPWVKAARWRINYPARYNWRIKEDVSLRLEYLDCPKMLKVPLG